jgi:hypothetical protein
MQDNCLDSHRVADYVSIWHAFALDHPDEPDKSLKGSRISPADLTDLQERFRLTELREQDVAWLTARNSETELRRVEQQSEPVEGSHPPQAGRRGDIRPAKSTGEVIRLLEVDRRQLEIGTKRAIRRTHK